VETPEQIFSGDRTEIFLVKPISTNDEHLTHNCNNVLQLISSKLGCSIIDNHNGSNAETNTITVLQGSELTPVSNHPTMKQLGIWISPLSDEDFEDEYIRQQKKCAIIPENPVAILDCGQSDSNRPTAKKEYVDELLRLFEESGVGVIFTSGKRSRENLKIVDNMQRWRRSKTDSLDLLQTIHLEIKNTGGLDEVSCQGTAEKIAGALEQYISNETLANEAYKTVANIFVQHLSKAMEEVGHYLFKTFFDENITLARQKQPNKNLSFHQFIKMLHDNHAHPPSKSWCYNAVNLAADKKEFEMEGFTDYEKIGLTHKVYLTQVGDKELKKQLIQETIESRLSVRQLLQKIQDTKKERMRIDSRELPSKQQMESFDVKRLMTYKKKVENKIKKLETQLSLYEISKRQYLQFQRDLARCIEQKNSESKKKK